MLVFSAKFLAALAIFYVVFHLPVCQHALSVYLNGIAHLANALVHCLGEPSQADGATVSSPQFAITISPDCSALEYVCFLWAFVVAFPATWIQKALGCLAVCIYVPLLNTLRAGSLYLTGVHAHRLFDLVHRDAWSVLLILFSILFAYGWISWVQARPTLESKTENASA